MNYTVLQNPISMLLIDITYLVKPIPPTNIITNETILTQYSIKKGLKVFGNKGESEVRKELQHFHDRRVV